MNRENVFLQVNSRHIGQLGRELVTDYVTALTELIKNSYDADSEAVEIVFKNLQSANGKIYILDTGCGFTKNDIIKKWAVIGTNSKVKNPYSKRYKRKCAGKKGIGRFSVERLAEYCTILSINEISEPVKYYINWNNFEGLDITEFNQKIHILETKPDIKSAKYIKTIVEFILNNQNINVQDKLRIANKIPSELKYTVFLDNPLFLKDIAEIIRPIILRYADMEQKVDQVPTVISPVNDDELYDLNFRLDSLYNAYEIQKEKHTGTLIVLEGLRDEWKQKDIQKVFRELRGLISPFEEDNNFHIKLSAEDYDIIDQSLTNGILSLNYAKFEGEFNNEQGILNYVFTIQNKGVIEDQIKFEDIFLCGDFKIKLYYFLRDNKLKSESIKLRDARSILDQYSGVKIYRDGFRVRPYGDSGNDWLLLDYKKIKDTHSYRVGNNQLIGDVSITSENNFLLVDSTNRESIIENEAFEQLKSIIERAINVIESDRYQSYLEELNNNKIKKSDEQKKKMQLESMGKLTKVYQEIEDSIQENKIYSVPELVLNMMVTFDSEREKSNRYYEEVKAHYEKKIEFDRNELNLYKNLATLGIFAGSFGHETDDIIARLLTNVEFFKPLLENTDAYETYLQLQKDITKISNYSDMLISYLKKSKREYSNNLSIKTVLNNIIDKYKEMILSYNIMIDTTDIKDFIFAMPMMQIDIESIILNMLTNAFEALKGEKRKIIKISTENSFIDREYKIVFEDSGKGIPEEKKEWIFIPLNTTKKEDGVGLGLTIVKDIVSSYSGKIYVEKSAYGGARFVIIIPYKEEENE